VPPEPCGFVADDEAVKVGTVAGVMQRSRNCNLQGM